jgi:hypothetical protein
MGEAAAIVAAVAAVAGAGANVDASQKQAREEEKARAAERQATRIRQQSQERKLSRERRRQVREARVARAEQVVAAQSTGTGGSSINTAIQGNITSQSSANLNFIDAEARSTRSINEFNSIASRHRQRGVNRQRDAANFNAVTSAIGTGAGGFIK